MIDKTIIHEMANWVRLRLTPEEEESMAKEFSETLEWINDEMITKELEDVKPMPSVIEGTIPMFEDKVTDGNYPETVTSCSEHTVDGFFTVPKMVE